MLSLHKKEVTYGQLGIVFMGLITVLIYAFGIESMLTLTRESIGEHQYTRIFTAHLVHWDLNHLIWDLIPFVVLGFVSVRMNPKLTFLNVGLSMLLISVGFIYFETDLNSYRGLSGIDSALFTSMVIYWAMICMQRKQFLISSLSVALLIGFIAKSMYEFATGNTLFADNSNGLYVAVASAHLIGGLVGVVTGMLIFRLSDEYHSGEVSRFQTSCNLT